MGTKFSFWACGILAIAAFSMFLYVSTSLVGREDVGNPLLQISVFIIGSFLIYMFIKLFKKEMIE